MILLIMQFESINCTGSSKGHDAFSSNQKTMELNELVQGNQSLRLLSLLPEDKTK